MITPLQEQLSSVNKVVEEHVEEKKKVCHCTCEGLTYIINTSIYLSVSVCIHISFHTICIHECVCMSIYLSMICIMYVCIYVYCLCTFIYHIWLNVRLHMCVCSCTLLFVVGHVYKGGTVIITVCN